MILRNYLLIIYQFNNLGQYVSFISKFNGSPQIVTNYLEFQKYVDSESQQSSYVSISFEMDLL